MHIYIQLTSMLKQYRFQCHHYTTWQKRDGCGRATGCGFDSHWTDSGHYGAFYIKRALCLVSCLVYHSNLHIVEAAGTNIFHNGCIVAIFIYSCINGDGKCIVEFSRVSDRNRGVINSWTSTIWHDVSHFPACIFTWQRTVQTLIYHTAHWWSKISDLKGKYSCMTFLSVKCHSNFICV